MRYGLIIKVINNYIYKTHFTIPEMKEALGNWTVQEKKTLFKWGVPNYDEQEYDSILEEADENKLWDYEKQIFENISKKRRDNIVKHLTGFDEKNYEEDDDVGYPSDERGALESRQEQVQEKQGYDDDIPIAIKFYWCGGFYKGIQKYITDGKKPENLNMFDEEWVVKSASTTIPNYIKDSPGLETDTILYRGGPFIKGMKPGEIKETETLRSTSYSKKTAKVVGIDFSDDASERYMIKIYAPEGTKGCMVNAPSLAHYVTEHEYLLGSGQKYIVLDVDDDKKTATIKLIND